MKLVCFAAADKELEWGEGRKVYAGGFQTADKIVHGHKYGYDQRFWDESGDMMARFYVAPGSYKYMNGVRQKPESEYDPKT